MDGRFGVSVSLDGDTAIVGATGAGSAYVFTRSGTTWSEQAKLTSSAPQPFGAFGNSVSLDGDTAIVGAPQENSGG
ncbi:MAG: FG-GAP repeat protein, partial [Planctomycetota bacterium]